ncbi:MAG: YihY/virulence factor BrkB family protein [Gomphosphaeria aponina SAG 52.96 = DSM 107014]|uniref:YihY/virulence factor BrkB family protein n=1 Tax=Gomphosphaeria aponina SAG 52.96 = DSM 107014 TaxID=1521640 RepID=A0A941GSL8_9CHRO|nr:YihY/virulence factor BrkB family protein [Gomphosphaeria aponina SAG 52.96 = DSM 107014]
MILSRLVRFFPYLNWVTLKKTIVRVVETRLMGLSAEMAYHTMLALFPGIFTLFTAIGMLEESVKLRLGNLVILLREILPEQVWTLLLAFAEGIKLREGGNWFSVSFVVALWIASGGLSAAMNALDQIHKVPLEEKRPFWKAKLISIVLTIGTFFLLILASFLVLLGDLILEVAFEQNWRLVLLGIWQVLSGPVMLAIAFTALSLTIQIYRFVIPANELSYQKIKYIFGVILVSAILLKGIDFCLLLLFETINQPEINQTVTSMLLSIWRILSLPVALGIVITVCYSIYLFGVSRRIKDSLILPGAILAAIAWVGLSVAFRLYVAHFGQYNQVYGAVGGVIVLMLWLYISSFVLLLGDQLNVIIGEEMKIKFSPVEDERRSN